MAEQTPEQSKAPAGGSRGIIIVLLLVIAAMGGKIYSDYRDRQELGEQLTTTEEDLSSTKTRLEEISKELDQKIAEISKLGGDIEALQKAKAEVEATLKKNKAWGAKNIKELKERVDGYEKLLKMKDEELEKLRSLNDELHSENTDLKSQQNRLSDSLGRLARKRDELAGKVAIASRLRAENIRVVAINSSNKERESPFRGRQMEKLKVSFNLAENKVAPIEGKKIMFRIADETGQIIFDLSKGSGTFMMDGKEEWYTAAQEILFDNTRQELTFTYAKGSEYAVGNYTIELFADFYKIGSAQFSVR